jgi:hypothetical protein
MPVTRAIEGAQRIVSKKNRVLCASDSELGGRRPAGRAGGCAEAPRAGLPPYGLPSLTRNGPSPRTRQLLIHRKLPPIRVGPFAEQSPGGQSSLAPDKGTAAVLAVNQTNTASAGRKMCALARHAFR